MKILMIGNSHSNDTFYQLGRVFNAQGYQENVYIGFLYYSGCSLSQHIQFGTNDDAVYEFRTSDGDWWKHRIKVTLSSALQEQPWDVVVIIGAKSDITESLNERDRTALVEFVNRYLPTPHRFYWLTTWPSPTENSFFRPGDPFLEGYKANLMNLYGFNRQNQFGKNVIAVQNNIFSDPNFAGAICVGKGIMLATEKLGIPQTEIYRDYTHLNDFGRLIASYCFYTQFTGKPVAEVKVDVIPAQNREERYRRLGDLTITAKMKDIIKTCANGALADPWTVPEI